MDPQVLPAENAVDPASQSGEGPEERLDNARAAGEVSSAFVSIKHLIKVRLCVALN